jgi:nicotinate-nucleotide adenylyltransferase
VTDKDILSAIAHHTFGKAHMSLIEKIVYLADFFEPNRPKSVFVNKAKELAYQDIDRAMLFVLGFTLERNERQGKAIYYKTLEAKEYYENEQRSYI